MKWRITLYHGEMRKDLMEKLISLCNGRNSEGDFIYEGTLDNFSNKWGNKFLVYPEFNMIAVTQYNTFGAR